MTDDKILKSRGESLKQSSYDRINRILIGESWATRIKRVTEKTGETAKAFCEAEGVSEFIFNRSSRGKQTPTEESIILVEQGFRKRKVAPTPSLTLVINKIFEKHGVDIGRT